MRCCFFFCTAEVNDDHPTSENGKQVVLTSGRPAFQQHAKRTEGSDTTPSFACAESPARRVKKQQHHQIANRAARPSGAATPRDSDAHHAHRCSEGFLCSSGAHPAKAQNRQSLPFYPLATQGFRNVRNGPMVVIPPPSEMPPVSACKPLCARFGDGVACVPAAAP